jgi:hypothetical protein
VAWRFECAERTERHITIVDSALHSREVFVAQESGGA